MVSSQWRWAPAPPRPPQESNVASLVGRLLLTRFAPASVIVSERGDVVYIHGRTGAYLEPAAGQPRNNILDTTANGIAKEFPFLPTPFDGRNRVHVDCGEAGANPCN